MRQTGKMKDKTRMREKLEIRENIQIYKYEKLREKMKTEREQ